MLFDYARYSYSMKIDRHVLFFYGDILTEALALSPSNVHISIVKPPSGGIIISSIVTVSFGDISFVSKIRVSDVYALNVSFNYFPFASLRVLEILSLSIRLFHR